MTAVSSWREDSFDVPSKLDSMVQPSCAGGIRRATWILLPRVYVEEKQLVGATAAANLAAVE